MSIAIRRQFDRRMTALSRANEVRVARARLKQQLREGDAHVEQILARPPECVFTATVLDLLLAVPKIGPVRAGRLLNSAHVKETKIICTLTERQRADLIDLLRNRTETLSKRRRALGAVASSRPRRQDPGEGQRSEPG